MSFLRNKEKDEELALRLLIIRLLFKETNQPLPVNVRSHKALQILTVFQGRTVRTPSVQHIHYTFPQLSSVHIIRLIYESEKQIPVIPKK